MKTATASAHTGITLIWTANSADRWRSNTVEHGLKDGKGRSIGNYAVIEAATWLSNTSYVVRTSATRDGHTFGAIANGTECKSLDDAKALAEKKIAAAGKRFARQVAKGEGKQFARKETAS